jgi:circadian clock protein KaiB
MRICLPLKIEKSLKKPPDKFIYELMNEKSKIKSKASAAKIKAVKGDKYVLRLFVAGILPNSVRAIKNIKAICELNLKDRYELDIIDIYQQPSLALSEELIAIPVLIRKFPLPEERMIGDLSDAEKVRTGLDLV